MQEELKPEVSGTNDVEKIRQSLAVIIEPGDVHELRVPKAGKLRTVSGYYNNLDRLAHAIAKLSGKAEGVYLTLNPVPPALLARAKNRCKSYADNLTTDTDIVGRKWLLVDVDPVRPAGISSSKEEKQAAGVKAKDVRAYLSQRDWPAPVAMDSGNGYHLRYRIDLPNDKPSTALIKGCLEALATRFNDDAVKVDTAVFNASRIAKVPGSLAAKGDNTPDRPHRQAQLLRNASECTGIVSADLLKALASEAPKQEQAKRAESPNRKITPDKVEEYLANYDVKHDEARRIDIGWMWILRPCPLNPSHVGTSPAIILRDDGTLCWQCKHESCQMPWKEFRKALEELHPEKPKFHFFEKSAGAVLGRPRKHLQTQSNDDGVSGEATSTEAKPPSGDRGDIDDISQVRDEVDRIMRMPSHPTKDEEGMPLREKSRMICDLIIEHMEKAGKLYNCGNVATYIDEKYRNITQITKDSQAFQRLLMTYGIYPGDKLADDVGKAIGAHATGAKKATVYNISWYDAHHHLLYVNEYGGKFLRIDGNGKIERLRNGDDDMLSSDGSEAGCDPLRADLEMAPDFAPQGALNPEGDAEESLIRSQILDTILYPNDGIGRENAHIILMTAILTLFFQERVPSNPYIYLYGAGASMKSSLAVKVGKLIQGRGFKVRPATTDEKALKDMALSLPFLVLDEANSVKKLMDLLKTIATGGMDTRRELYTTARMRHTPYQARIWLTANTASLTNETISSRMMIIDAAARTEQEPYRSEHYLEWTPEDRNRIWTELVGRLAKAMAELAQADAKGEGDLSVSNRMSSFFVFGRALARQEGWEDRFLGAMEAMGKRQEASASEGNDIVDLVKTLPASYADTPRLASEWAGILSNLVPFNNVELRRNCSRTGWVAWQFNANAHILTKECGMVKHADKHKNTTRYAFTKLGQARPFGDVAEQTMDDVFLDEWPDFDVMVH